MTADSEPQPEVSVVIPTINEAENIGRVVGGVQDVCAAMDVAYEILVVDGGSTDETAAAAEGAGARVIRQQSKGYGGALREAFAEARGRYVVTMDSDQSHPPDVIRNLYQSRDVAEVVIASRFVRGGQANMPWTRKVLSVVLNRVFSWVLAVPIRDLSSGFRLYHRRVLKRITTRNSDFSVLQELLVQAYSEGYKVAEVPFHYFPRVHGSSKARIIKFGISYLRLLRRSRKLRTAMTSADYEQRMYGSWILPARWWHRRRYQWVTTRSQRQGRILDAGCGSSRIFEALPSAVGLDARLAKLRYRRSWGSPLVCGDLARLPFPAEQFDEVICSSVIEQVSDTNAMFAEIRRVLAPGGQLLLTTPDHARWQWRLASWAYRLLVPSARGWKPRVRYTGRQVEECLAGAGFEIAEKGYLFGAELVVRARVPAGSSAP